MVSRRRRPQLEPGRRHRTMFQPVSSSTSSNGIQASSATAIHLRGHWLTLARAGWLVTAGLSLVLAGIGLPQFSAQLHTVYAGASCPGVEVSPAVLRTLLQARLSIGACAVHSLTPTLLSALVWCAAGLFFWRKSDDWCILAISLQAVTQGRSGNGIRPLCNPAARSG
jgi:hypothetical protein